MAVTHDATTTASDGTSTASTTFSHTCTGTSSDGLLLVDVCQDGNSADTAVNDAAYNSIAMSSVNQAYVGFVLRTSRWYLKTPSTGANNVVVTYASTVTQNRTFIANSYTGVDQTTTLRTQQNANGGGSTPSITYTNGQNDDLISGFLGTFITYASTPGSGQTARGSVSLTTCSALASDEAGSTSVVTDYADSHGGSWRFIVNGIIPAAAAGHTPRLSLLGVG